MTAAVSSVYAIDPVSLLTVDGLGARESHLASLRHQLAEARATSSGASDTARVQLLIRRKAEVEARIDSIRRDAALARQAQVDAGEGAAQPAAPQAVTERPQATPAQAEAAPTIGSQVDEFA